MQEDTTKNVYMQINSLNQQLEREQGQDKPLNLKEEIKEEGLETALETGLENLIDISIDGGIANIAIPVPALKMFLKLFQNLENVQEGGISR